MPPLPPAPLTIKAVVEGTIAGQPYANIFHLLYDHAAPTVGQMNEVATTVGSNYVGNILPSVNSVVLTNTCVATDLNASDGNVGIAGIPGVGGIAGVIPASACFLVKHSIARRYRGGHPRTYLPPGANSELHDAKTWTDPATAAIQAGFDAMITAILTSDISTTLGGFTYCSVSYHTGHALRVTPVSDPILASTAENKIASQRRRLGR